MAFIKKKIDLPELDSPNFQKEIVELLIKYSLNLSDAINGGLKINENVQGFPGDAVADATGAGDIVAQFNALLAVLRTLKIIDT